MKFLLVAMNAKYIHSNLAVFSLQAYARAQGHEVAVAEYTINHLKEAVLRSIFREKPDVIGFSCYIWNMEEIQALVQDIHQIMPDLPIWLGGPEVTWNPEERLRDMPYVTGIMVGEGEETLTELLAWYKMSGREGRGQDQRQPAGETGDQDDGRKAEAAVGMGFSMNKTEGLAKIRGLCIRQGQEIILTPPRPLLDMDALVFCYGNLAGYENRIIYYESSRGCPFSCSYCLSSVEKQLRFRSLELVFEELDFFLAHRVRQVKFVDRTFNCRHDHAYAIWNYINEHDNGVTNFHFEISADLIREEDLSLMATMRPGLIQLETGVQTTNPDTIKAIGRRMDLALVAENTRRIKAFQNIHQHLDLIAGLPEEGLDSFARSFNEVYAMGPDELQLGFLKVLHGTRMRAMEEVYGLNYSQRPTYEIFSNRWLSYGDILCLKEVEDALEVYYNSKQFANTLDYVTGLYPSPFTFYQRLGSYRQAKGLLDMNQNRLDQYETLRQFLLDQEARRIGKEPVPEAQNSKICMDPAPLDVDRLDKLLSFDYCLRERLKKIPSFLPDQEPYKKLVSDFYAREIRQGHYFGRESVLGEGAYRKLRGRTQALVFPGEEGRLELVIFDYENRNPLDHNAAVINTIIPQEELL